MNDAMMTQNGTVCLAPATLGYVSVTLTSAGDRRRRMSVLRRWKA